MSFQIKEATISKIHSELVSSRITTTELVQGYLDRIENIDSKGPKLNSIVTINPRALQEAKDLMIIKSRRKIIWPASWNTSLWLKIKLKRLEL